MKKLLFILFLALPLIASAQSQPPNQTFSGLLYEFKYALRADSVFLLPRTDTIGIRSSLLAPGAMIYRLANKTFYGYNGSYWVSFSSGINSALDSLRYDPSTATFYARYTTGGEIAVPTGLLDSLKRRWDSIAVKNYALQKPFGTDNTLNALLVVDGQNKTWIRSTDSLPYIKTQLAILQAADQSVTGTFRHQGAFQLIEPAASVVNLIDFRKPDFSTITGRIGTFLPGVFGRDNSFGILSPSGPNWLIAKRDSTIAIGYIDGTTVSAKLAWRGQNLLIRQGGMTVNLNGVLVDSASGVPITPTALMDIRGANAITIASSGRITAADAVNAIDLATKGQNDITYKNKISYTKTVTASATNLITDEATFINNPAATTTITLPAAAGNTGRILEFAVNNSAGQTVTVGPYTTNATSGGCRLVSDGSNWRIISKF